MSAPVCVLTVLKSFPYRGNAEEWSNTYFLTGATPADDTAWRTLFDAMVTQEKTLYNHGAQNVQVVGGYGYDHVPDSTHHAVWSVDLRISPDTPVNGTLASDSGSYTEPGDVAAWIRWGLDRLNSKGKRIYLRKYYHGVPGLSSDQDKVEASFTTNAAAFAEKMIDGTFAGGRTLTDRLGTAVLGHKESTYLTTRTLKRRGKRP